MIELKLPTMTCGHCVKAVTETVRRVDPEARLEVDLPAQTVRIDSGRLAESFVAALADEGYAPA